MTISVLRDHAEAMLRFIAVDIESEQSAAQQSAKSKGLAKQETARMTGAHDHGLTRAIERFTLDELASEFRALRASVTEMWLRRPGVEVDEARQLIRFSESVDQLLAESISHFVAKQERTSELFTAAIGHDLRNPLNMVALGIHSLGLSEGLSSNDRKILEQVGGAVSRQGRLLDDLASFSRTRMGGLAELHRSECDVFNLCNAMAKELAPSHPNIVPTGLGHTIAFVDPLRIEQMLSNLVANAVQHGSPSGMVTATVVGTTDNIEISVHNEGPPIPKDRLDNVFNPFIRGAHPDEHHGHLGLGLFIAREIAVAHGGTLTVKSDTGIGTTFTATIPRRSPESE